jgi:hypothetical protein
MNVAYQFLLIVYLIGLACVSVLLGLAMQGEWGKKKTPPAWTGAVFLVLYPISIPFALYRRHQRRLNHQRMLDAMGKLTKVVSNILDEHDHKFSDEGRTELRRLLGEMRQGRAELSQMDPDAEDEDNE